jgi:hypothetical protein
VKWLLGEEEPANFNIEEEGIRPRATWRAGPRIVRWGITWRQESPAVPASLGILGETPNVMVCTGFSVLKVDYANDSIWDDAVVALIAVHPMVEGDGEDDHIAVIMNAKLCYHACCAGANDKGMQFASGFAEEAEDVVFAFRDVSSQKMRVNRELKGKTAEKRPKRPRAKKADAAVGTQETDETVETEESSKKKGRRKAPESDATTSGASGEKTPKSRKAPKKLTLGEAILQANSLSSKSKPTEVEVMYKTLEEGLGACFPYRQDPIPHKISADRIHLALDTMKYRTFIEKRKEQIQLEHTALGIIRKKSELYCVALKREPGWKPDESGELLVKDEGVDLIMGGQHTYTACKQIGEKEEFGSERYDFYMNHKIIPIYLKDEDMLIKVSNTLNIQVKDKVVTENFRSQLANMQAKWIEKGRPHPAAGGGRHDSEFRVYIAALTFTVVFGPVFP